MKKLVFFDLDGTLTDSGPGIMNSAAYAFERMGYPVPPLAVLRTFVGPPLHESFLRNGIPAEMAEKAVAVFRERYMPIGKYENTPYEGIRTFLESLKSLGYKLMIATSKPEEIAIEVLEHFDLAKYFDKICGGSMDLSRTSKEAVIAYLLEENGRDAEMVMVGDTRFDIIGAKKHGIPAIGVSWGYGDVGEMEQAGAAAIAKTPEDLLEILKSDAWK